MTQEEQVLIRGKVFLYRQKAPFVPSGKSVLGALEYDEATDSVRCHECGEWKRLLGSHIKSHGLDPLQYRVKHGLNRKAALCGIDLSSKISSRPQSQRLGQEAARRRPWEKGVPAAASARSSRRALARVPASQVAEGMLYELRNERGRCHAQILDDVRKLADDLGHTPTTSDLRKVGIHERSVCVAFNVPTVSAFMSLIGLVPNATGGKGHIQTVGYSREILIELLRDFYVKFGRLPSSKDARACVIPTRKVFMRVFGSMGEAYEAAGLANVPHRKEWSEQELIKALQEFYRQHQRLPNIRGGEFSRSSSLPTRKVFHRVFGSIAEAYEAAGLTKAAGKQAA